MAHTLPAQRSPADPGDFGGSDGFWGSSGPSDLWGLGCQWGLGYLWGLGRLWCLGGLGGPRGLGGSGGSGGSGDGVPVITRSGQPDSRPSFAATSPVPSELPSSTRMTVSAPGYSCPRSAGSVSGSISASFLAGTTASTSGHAAGSSVAGRRPSAPRPAPPLQQSRMAPTAHAT